MRQNRISQRLKSKLDSFGFDALIKGVSSLVEETTEIEPADRAAKPQLVLEPPPITTEVSPAIQPVVALRERESLASSPLPSPVNGRSDVSQPSETVEVAPFWQPDSREPTSPVSATAVLEQGRPSRTEIAKILITEPESAPVKGPGPQSGPEPLREALHALSCRLTQEAGRMAAALEQRDGEEAGFYLAHLNQILELLHTLDARGDMARRLGVANAPPVGRTWPLTAWTVVEFAGSPFSALLPPDASEGFVREVIYAAWGISFNGGS